VSYLDTLDGLEAERSLGVSIHNPAVWTIRNLALVEQIHRAGFRQKQIFGEGCAHRCKLEPWHRRESANGNHHSLEETCRMALPKLEDFLMGSWVTLKQLRRMEWAIDRLKVPRNTFDSYFELVRLVDLYDSGEPYNILDFVSTPLRPIKAENEILSSVFDDTFFDETSSGTCSADFLEYYASQINRVPFFRRSELR
jgi:hypothetical protein